MTEREDDRDFSCLVNCEEHFYTNNDMVDWLIISAFNKLRSQAESLDLELEANGGGGFTITVKYSGCPYASFKYCQNLREVEVFIRAYEFTRNYLDWFNRNH